MDEFKDVFFSELNDELMLLREIYHVVDLVIDAIPIARAPYCHYLAQNVELTNQLNDLLNKRYIKSSILPILFIKKRWIFEIAY